MASDRKQKQSNSIPIRFPDDDDPIAVDDDAEFAERTDIEVNLEPDASDAKPSDTGFGGPDLAELIASRAELKRLQTALDEAREGLARRQADFENYRKRIERERGEAQLRVVGEVARKLLPVTDNLTRALDAEKTVQSHESKEFRHFLHGVELINRQLNEVLESLASALTRTSTKLSSPKPLISTNLTPSPKNSPAATG